MSTSPETDFDLELHFLPAWAQKAPDQNRYASHQGESARDERKHGSRDRRDQPPRRPSQPGRGPGGPSRPPQGDRARGPQRDYGRHGGSDNQNRREVLPPPAPLPELNVSLIPDEKGVESLARQIKMTGRAYPLFDIAHMVLQKPERHSVSFSVEKKPDGTPIQPLFVCALDDTLWLSEDEAVQYVIDKHFTTFYQAERTEIPPPKGTYTFVAQCGISGVVLGPPNYHDYQNQLRKLHTEKFSRMPFDAFKARVKIVRDEVVVKKWLDDQSWKTEYVCLNLPEPLRLGNREEVEKHFRQTHLANIVKQVETFQLSGVASRNLRSPALARLVRQAWEDQKRFPLQLATVLSQQFAGHGLQFFKVNRTLTHVAVARPHYLDLDATPVSEGVKKIVDYINSHPKATRRQLVETLAPAPAPAAPPAEGAAPAEPTPEMTAVVSDLHWLVHQGHVIEFANGILDTAKRPLPRPVKQPAAKKETAVAPAEAGTETAEPTAGEVTVAPDAASPTGEASATTTGLADSSSPSGIVSAEGSPAAPQDAH